MIVDFHSHILPGIDDGSQSPEESMAMLKLMAEQGITEVVATPHFYPQHTTQDRFLMQRADAYRQLAEHAELSGKTPRIRLGAEVYFFDHMSHVEELKTLTIQDTNAILVEMPMRAWTSRMYQELENIHANLGLVPIIAHVDRYLGRFRDYGIPQRLSALPVLVQANASFFLSRMSASKGLKMLSRDQIHLLGSDCHNLTTRKPNLGQAVNLILRKQGQGAIERIRDTERMLFSMAEEGLT